MNKVFDYLSIKDKNYKKVGYYTSIALFLTILFFGCKYLPYYQLPMTISPSELVSFVLVLLAFGLELFIILGLNLFEGFYQKDTTKKLSYLHYLWALVLFIFTKIAVDGINNMSFGGTTSEESSNPVFSGNPTMDTGGNDVMHNIYLVVFITILLAPILEELFYRMFIIKGVKSILNGINIYNKYLVGVICIIVASSVFALVHTTIIISPYFWAMFVLSMLFSVVYILTDKIWLSIVLHIFWNLIIMYPLISVLLS